MATQSTTIRALAVTAFLVSLGGPLGAQVGGAYARPCRNGEAPPDTIVLSAPSDRFVRKGEYRKKPCSQDPHNRYDAYELIIQSARTVQIVAAGGEARPALILLVDAGAGALRPMNLTLVRDGNARIGANVSLERGRYVLEVAPSSFNLLDDTYSLGVSSPQALASTQSAPSRVEATGGDPALRASWADRKRCTHSERPLDNETTDSFSPATSCRNDEGALINYHYVRTTENRKLLVFYNCADKHSGATQVAILDAGGKVLVEKGQSCFQSTQATLLSAPIGEYYVRVASISPKKLDADASSEIRQGEYRVKATCRGMGGQACVGAGLAHQGIAATPLPAPSGAQWKVLAASTSGSISVDSIAAGRVESGTLVWVRADLAEADSSRSFDFTGPVKQNLLLLEFDCRGRRSRVWAMHAIGVDGTRVGGATEANPDWERFVDAEEPLGPSALDRVCRMVGGK